MLLNEPFDAFEIEKTLRGITVLVVDDEPDVRELVTHLLVQQGAHVHEASATSGALAYLATHTPDVMISDIGMPGEDGYSLIERVRALGHRGKRNIPCIALTAYARDIDRDRALLSGFDVHLPKPFQFSALLQWVVALHRTRTAHRDS